MRLFVTNNPMFYKKYKDSFEVLYKEISLREVLLEARDLIHKNYVLQTHPLSGNINTAEMPFKTLLLNFDEEINKRVDFTSLSLIEAAIYSCDKSICENYHYTEKVINDYMYVDMSLMLSTIDVLK